MAEKASKYRARQPGQKKTKTIGFVPSPDLDTKLRAMAEEQEVTVSRVVDGLIRDGLEARNTAGRDDQLSDRLEAALVRLEARALLDDEDLALKSDLHEFGFVGALMRGNPVAKAYADLLTREEVFLNPLCRALMRHVDGKTIRPSMSTDDDLVVMQLTDLLEGSEPGRFDAEFLRSNIPMMLRFGELLEPAQVEGRAIRLLVLAGRRLMAKRLSECE